MYKPTVKMLCGLPASGKSTLADKILKVNPELGYVSSDFFLDGVADALDLTYDDIFRDEINNATNYVKHSVKWLTARNQSFIWDQTLSTEKSRAKAFRMIPNQYEIEIIYFTIDEQEQRERLDLRSYMEGKTIPSHVIEGMRINYELPSLKEDPRIRTIYKSVLWVNPKCDA